jgi:hypothetical protein
MMKHFKDIIIKEVSKLVCDGCGEQATPSDYAFHEFISMNKRCGYGSIHGDGNQLSIDLCQQCFANMCGDSLTVTEPNNEKHEDNDLLEYHNIFEAITQSKKEASCLKYNSDLRMAARDMLSANKISNQEELTVALKRVEQLWDVQYNSVEGNELHQLADLICDYEGKSWDSYFNEVDAASDDFMAERNIIIEQKCPPKALIKGSDANKSFSEEESLESPMCEDIELKKIVIQRENQPETEVDIDDL